MKVIILGSTGMLGHAVAKHFLKTLDSGDIFLLRRKEKYDRLFLGLGANPDNIINYDAVVDDPQFLADMFGVGKNDPTLSDPIYAINCIGTIKPMISLVGNSGAILINSVLPHRLAEMCEKTANMHLIHVTTDCVWNGSKGGYVEDWPHDADDVYGRSKSLGEPVENAMVLRTSIIGNELGRGRSLVSWLKSQSGKTVDGYINHFWNGMTTTTLAKCIHQIIENDLWQQGMYHLHSEDTNKAELLRQISVCYGLKIDLVLREVKKVDRTLRTNYDLNGDLNIPTLWDQIRLMAKES